MSQKWLKIDLECMKTEKRDMFTYSCVDHTYEMK